MPEAHGAGDQPHTLRVGGEQRYAVPPLAVPERAALAPGEPLPNAAAVTLFVQRAHAVEPDFSLTADNAAAVAAICRRLDGVPLAIELAATRSNTLDPGTLAARLGRSLPLLTGGAHDAPHRLQTMRNAIAWSYDLLTAQEQVLFRHLSVFVGGIPLDFIEGEIDILASLVDKQLVRRMQRSTDGARFGMFETLREYGLEQLAAAGEEEAARDAHVAYYCRLAAEAGQGLKGHEQVAWLDRLETEHDNIRAVFALLRERGATEQAAPLAESLRDFWSFHGHYAEARRQLEALLARPEITARTSGRATALSILASAIDVLGDPDQALLLHDEALSIFRECGNKAGIARSLKLMNVVLAQTGQVERALADGQECIALYREMGDAAGLAAILTFRGNVLNGLNDWASAASLYEESLAISRRLGNRWYASTTLHNLGRIALDTFPATEESLARASALFAESMQMSHELESKHGVPWDLLALGTIRRRQGDLAQAVKLFEDGLTVARETGDTEIATFLVFELGVTARQQGDQRRAAHAIRESFDLALARNLAYQRYESIEQIAYLARERGQAERAARLLGAADRLLVESNTQRREHQRAEHERETAKVRAALGESAFAATWEVGRALALDEVTAEVATLEAEILATPLSPGELGESAMERTSPATSGLTPRELDVLRLLAEGHSDRQIGDALFISRRTAAGHVASILAKLDLPSRTAAAAYAVRHGLA